MSDVQPVAEPAQKRPEGRAGHLSAEEKQAIRLAYLEAGGTLTYKQLAARFNVNRDTVSACCKGPEFVSLQKQFEREIRASAVERLKALVLPAADAWGTAIPIAAKKGDHRPARELLQHAGIVEANKDGGGSGLLVLTKVEINGVSMAKDSEGTLYDRDPDTGEVIGLPQNRTIVSIGMISERDVAVVGEQIRAGVERQIALGGAPRVVE